MIVSYKYRLKGKRAARKLRRFAWAVNQVWNFCVATQRKVTRNWRDGLRGKWPSHFELAHLACGTSKELGVNSKSIQAVCAQFATARDTRKKCPRFRASGGAKRTLGWVPIQQQGRRITSCSVTYCGSVFRFFGAKRRPLPATAKGGAFVEDARGRWYVCFHVEVATDTHCGVGEIGIDLGLKSLAVTSDGDVYEAPQFFRASEKVLGAALRTNNRQRSRAIHARVKNQRADHLHKLSTRLVQRYGAIYVGDVNSAQLTKTNMAKSVSDAGWSTFREMLRYKASRHGAHFAIVDERLSTQTCSSCGALPPERPKGIAGLGMRTWVCSACGSHHDRDVNAAKNILAFGRSVAPPCGREAGLPTGANRSGTMVPCVVYVQSDLHDRTA